jgi:hypothetical protein
MTQYIILATDMSLTLGIRFAKLANTEFPVLTGRFPSRQQLVGIFQPLAPDGQGR